MARTKPPRIVVLGTDGAPIRSFGIPGAGSGELDFGDRLPAIAVGADGLLHVTEAGNSRDSVFEPDGTFLRHIGSFGDEPGRFLMPFDLVVDDAGGASVVTTSSTRCPSSAPAARSSGVSTPQGPP